MDGRAVNIVILGWIVCGTAAVALCALGSYGAVRTKRLQALPGRAQGTVTGLVCSHLLRNECQGDVPGGVLIGWGAAQGGGLPVKRVPSWFSCVSFTVDGTPVTRIFGEGAFCGTWEIGQNVTVLFDPAAPHISALEDDPSAALAVRKDVLTAAALLAAAVVLTLVF